MNSVANLLQKYITKKNLIFFALPLDTCTNAVYLCGIIIHSTLSNMTAQKFLEKYAKGERNFMGEDLTGADLTDADLTGADLEDANLTDANLTRANLTRADLTGVNLTRADLTGADLWKANLTGANLTGANLTDAYMYRANLYEANLHGVTLSLKQIGKAILTEDQVVEQLAKQR